MKIQRSESDRPASGSVSHPSIYAADAPVARPAKSKLKTPDGIAREREITNLIAEVEFGDWLIGERSEEPVNSLQKSRGAIKAKLSRPERLKLSETVLFEFLSLQQAMLKKAERTRIAQ